MKISMQLSQQLKQDVRLSLAQIIDFNNLITLPDTVMNVVIGAISYNPKAIENALGKMKTEKPQCDSRNKVQTLYASLTPSKGDENIKRKGMIITPDLRTLEGCLGAYPAIITPDVTYIARKDEKPEVVFSDHLTDSISLLMQLDRSLYPETSKLLGRLRNFDSWKRRTLRESYVLVGGVQREYFENFDAGRFNIFNQKDLAESLGLSEATISRILSNRWAEARNLEGEQKFMYAKDLLQKKVDMGRYSAFNVLNRILQEEFEKRRAFSDKELSERVPNIARRTLTKYRRNCNIPRFFERNAMYQSRDMTEPFRFV